jgi:TolB protein
VMMRSAAAVAFTIVLTVSAQSVGRQSGPQNSARPHDEVILTIQPARALTSNRDAEPDVSPDGTRVAFSRRIDDSPPNGRRQLWTVPFNGGDARPLSSDDFRYNATKPSWSPDGRVIAFRATHMVGDALHGGTWLMPSSGGDPKPVLEETSAVDSYAQWLPGGHRLVFNRDVPGMQTDVWFIDLDSRQTRQLTSHLGFDGKATVSPDGSEVAFPSERSGQRDIWIMPLAAGEAAARQFTTGGGRGPAWSPDGRWMAYGCPVGPERYALCLKALTGGGVTQVTDGTANDFNPEWAPDSKALVVSRTTGIAVIDVSRIVK